MIVGVVEDVGILLPKARSYLRGSGLAWAFRF